MAQVPEPDGRPMKLNHLRDLTVESPLASGHAFVSAASGIVVRENRLYVVADDAHCLAVFALDGDRPGELITLIEGDLPSDKADRKRAKPDFETLVEVPGASGDRLLALGSGSTAQRMRGAITGLGDAGEQSRARPIDLRPLFAALEPLVPEINVEGAVLAGDGLLLFNRGNMRSPASHVLEAPLGAVLAGGPVKALVRAELALPVVSGVPLNVTDACRLPDGRILLSTVAEETEDNYADGDLMGAAIVELDAEFAVAAIHPLDPPLKVEGIAIREIASGPELLCVNDADEPSEPSALYTGAYPPRG